MRSSLKNLQNLTFAGFGTISFVNRRGLAKMEELLLKIESEHDGKVELSAFDVDELYLKAYTAYIRHDACRLMTKDIRNLPVIFSYHKHTNKNHVMPMADRNFIMFLIDTIKSKPVMIKTILTAAAQYITYYDKKLPGTRLLAYFVYEQIENYPYRSPAIKNLRDASYLFKSSCLETLSTLVELAIDNRQLDSFIKGFENTTTIPALNAQMFIEAVRLYYFDKSYAQLTFVSNKKINSLEALFKAENEHTDLWKLLPDIASCFIPIASSEQCEPLRRFFIRTLGDPRSLSTTKWHRVSHRAKKIFNQWLVKRDLELFFNVIAKTDNDPGWKYRMDFWSGYIEHIESSWVVLGKDALRFLRANINYSEYSELSTLEQGNSSAQSAFLFEIGGYLFSEWSHNGKLRIWKKENAPVKIGCESYKTSQIKNSCGCEKEKVHSAPYTSWQCDIRAWLALHCKI